MIELKKVLFLLKPYTEEIKLNFTLITIKIKNHCIDNNVIFLLYYLLNNFEILYKIIIANLPYCLMPDATEHLVYKKNSSFNYYYDKCCEKCDFKKYCPGWYKNKYIQIDRKKMRPPKTLPCEIAIETTSQCNLDCKVCSLDKSFSLEISFSQARKILDECNLSGVKTVRFTGGEPLLNSAIDKMLLYARQKNFYVILNTNASLIDNKKLELIRKTTDYVLISLQGFNSKSNRILTGIDMDFNKKISNIIKLKTRVAKTRLGTVISKTLINNFEKYVSLIKKLEINDWDLYRPITKSAEKEFELSRTELLKIMRYAYRLKKKGLNVKIPNPIPFCICNDMNLSLAVLAGANADDGHSRMVWDLKGYFKPSYFINERLGTEIMKSWENPFIKKIRSLDYLPLKCKRCIYINLCKGGSRAASKNINHDYFSGDPYHELRRHFIN